MHINKEIGWYIGDGTPASLFSTFYDISNRTISVYNKYQIHYITMHIAVGDTGPYYNDTNSTVSKN